MKSKKYIDLWAIEKTFYEKYGTGICGIDEAGRGPLCGPVYAGAVILPENVDIKGINDSKKLSEKKRNELFEVIKEKAVAWSVAFASAEEIDDLNILNATFLAMRRAVQGLSVKPDFVLIDGNRMKGLALPFECIVKGDSLSINIAAASIMAKVSRDRYMEELSLQYPQYNLSKHKGYPTIEHYKLLKEHGTCSIYRKSFLKNLDEKFITI
ncbi:MAG: rnhB [Clostridia bacterium]|nr:rnhB [Clostridia bacterium]